MIARLPAGPGLPRPELELLLARYGTRRVLLSLVAALAAPASRPRIAPPLGPHLRRDIGLPPQAERPHYLHHL